MRNLAEKLNELMTVSKQDCVKYFMHTMSTGEGKEACPMTSHDSTHWHRPKSISRLSTGVLDHSSEEVSLENVTEELRTKYVRRARLLCTLMYSKPVRPTTSFTPSTKCSTQVEKLGYAPSNAGYDARQSEPSALQRQYVAV